MDENQFRDVLKLLEEHNKAMINTFLSSVKEIVLATKPAQSDHDLLIEIRTMVSGCQANCSKEKAVNKEHRDESVTIRDMVKKHDRTLNVQEKTLWVVIAAAVTALFRTFWR